MRRTRARAPAALSSARWCVPVCQEHVLEAKAELEGLVTEGRELSCSTSIRSWQSLSGTTTRTRHT